MYAIYCIFNHFFVNTFAIQPLAARNVLMIDEINKPLLLIGRA